VDQMTVQTAAGFSATIIFFLSNLPMLLKAKRTKNMTSYSLTNIALANLGNVVQWVYILGLPFGPIHFLHAFYTVSTMIMFAWYLQYASRQGTSPQREYINRDK